MPIRDPIYVESRIRCDMEDLWEATQNPSLHQRWDLRFGEIEYLPRAEGDPQKFRYATTILPGMTIGGTGESLGDRGRPDGSRWSGLRFWAQDRRSLINSGAGYWRYVPTEDGIRFLTRYDYRPRWGAAGDIIDRLAFRPVFGWATAWSFDRLRLWLEEGIPPERSRNRWLLHIGARTGLAALIAATWVIRPTRLAQRFPWAWVALLGTVQAATRRGRPSGTRPLRRAPDRQPDVGDLP